jgi:putative membrane protein
MYIYKNFSLRGALSFSGGHLIWLSLWAVGITCLYEYSSWNWLPVPWLPISLVGTAVAFYVGFKNNQSYDRTWEARKIWGAIVNSSRAWGSVSKSYISNQFTTEKQSEQALYNIKKQLIYRHIAWLYTLRKQLLIPTPWEHISQNKHVRLTTEKRIKQYRLGAINDDLTEEEILKLLPEGEYERLLQHKNTATQIIDQQAQNLQQLNAQGLIDNFRHVELQKILNDFYIHQGKAERIKKFPLPRQYGSMSFVFVCIFIFLLPFGMVSEFAKLGEWGAWWSIPFTILIGWVYIMMELVGDYSENPFEGLGNDIPMLSLCRTIEIDLREMLGETDLPSPIKAKNGVLM